MPMLYFCSRCGGSLNAKEWACVCCGAETTDANWISLLKRVSPRRIRGQREEEEPDDNWFPL